MGKEKIEGNTIVGGFNRLNRAKYNKRRWEKYKEIFSMKGVYDNYHYGENRELIAVHVISLELIGVILYLIGMFSDDGMRNIGFMMVTIGLVITLGFIIKGLVQIIKDKGINKITLEMYKSLILPLPIIYLIGYIKFRKNYPKYSELNAYEKMGKVMYDLIGNTGVSQVYELLNQPVRLESGYITYFSNVLKSTKDGIKTTTNIQLLENNSEELNKIDGFLIDNTNIEEYYNQLKYDYEFDKDFHEKDRKYEQLKKEEKERKERIEYKEKHQDEIARKREQSKNYLYTEFRKQDKEQKEGKIKSDLKEIQDELEQLSKIR